EQFLLFLGHLIDLAGSEDSRVFRRNTLWSIRQFRSACMPPVRDKLGNHRSLAGVTLLANLVVQPRGIVTTFVPPRLQIIREFGHLRRSPVRRLSLGELSCS